MGSSCSDISFLPTLGIEFILIFISLISILYKSSFTDDKGIVDIVYVLDLSCWIMFFIMIGFFTPESEDERSRFIICWLDILILVNFIWNYFKEEFRIEFNDGGINYYRAIFISLLFMIAQFSYFISIKAALLVSLVVCIVFMFKPPVELNTLTLRRIVGTSLFTSLLCLILYFSIFITVDQGGIRPFNPKLDLCKEIVE